MPLHPQVYQFLVSVFASLGSLLYGYDLGVVAEVVAAPAFTSEINPNDPNAVKSGLVVSTFTVGAFFGAFWAGPCGDYLGRKYTIFVGGLIFILGGGVQTGAQTISYMLGGRFVAGLGVGALIMIVPLYQAELAHPSIRGRITALQQFMLGVGNLIAAWISYGTYISFSDTDSAQWRIGLGIQILPALFLVALILLFPESPRWLIHHGKTEHGLKVLAQLHARGNEHDGFVQAEFEAISEAVTHEKEHEARSYLELFRTRSSFRRLVTAERHGLLVRLQHHDRAGVAHRSEQRQRGLEILHLVRRVFCHQRSILLGHAARDRKEAAGGDGTAVPETALVCAGEVQDLGV